MKALIAILVVSSILAAVLWIAFMPGIVSGPTTIAAAYAEFFLVDLLFKKPTA